MLPVYSISKPFLAQAVLELELPLHSQVGEHAAGLSTIYAERTVGALLNHTSGLLDYGNLADYHAAVAAEDQAWSRQELLERCQVLAHVSQSDAGFHYSNIGYLLLRMAVEQTASLSYFEALDKLVFTPLGLSHFAEWELQSTLVPGYDPRWVYSGTFLGEQERIAPALAALAKHRAATIGLSAGIEPVPYSNTGFDQPGYGFGFMNDGNPPTYVGHGGGGPGFQLMALVNTGNWTSGIKVSVNGDLDQAKAIEELKAQLAKAQ